MLARRIRILALLAVTAASAARAEEAKPLFSYTGALSGVVAGGKGRQGAYVHALTAGMQAPLAGGWSVTVQGAATAGNDLSAKAVGDVAGVQGPFNSGNGVWLYELKAAWAGERGGFEIGRIAPGDALPGVAGMDQFVNGAFASNGGAIAINAQGRGTTPAASWGLRGRRDLGGLELRGGAFLSDPRRMTLREHGLDWSFRPADGVLAYAEGVAPLGGGFKAGLGGWSDSGRLATFAGGTAKGNGGGYAWVERGADGPGLSGFAMVQAAPRRDRDLQPLFLIGGVTWTGLSPRRPKDSASLGISAGEFSKRSPLRGWETTLEANYRVTLSDHVGVRPDLQYVIAPGGRTGGRDALVIGVQLEAGL